VRHGLSISLRLTFWFSGIFLCAFTIFGALLVYFMTSSVNDARDEKLNLRAKKIVESIRGAHPSSDNLSLKSDDFIVPSMNGRLLQAYSLAGKDLKRDEVAEAQFPWPAVPVGHAEFRKSTMFDGRRYRIYVLTTSLHGVPLRVFVARILTDNPDLLDQPAWILIRFMPAILLVSALAGYFISRRALMPIVRLTESARSISIGNLAERLPVSPVDDELTRLAETCNAMLGRLEEAVTRITQFTADASHELRSPIAFIRVASEDTLRIPRMPAEAIQTLEVIVKETMHSQELLEDMLLLASIDADNAPLGFERIFPAEIIESVVSRMQVFATDKHQTLRTRLPDEDLAFAGNPHMFYRLVRILVDNAIKYTPPESVIEVALSGLGRQVRLTVSDNGHGISEAHLPYIFDRFFRVDPSRGEQKGAGLGLAIAKRIADVHHAEIIAQSRKGEGTRFEVTFSLVTSPIPSPL
jgi:heavy metal sensor kinase